MKYPSALIFKEAKILHMRQHQFLKIFWKQFKNKNNLAMINHRYKTRQKANKNLETEMLKKTFANTLPSKIRSANTIFFKQIN